MAYPNMDKPMDLFRCRTANDWIQNYPNQLIPAELIRMPNFISNQN